MNTKSIFKSNMTRLLALIFLFSLTTYMWADYSVTTPANLPTYYTSLSGKSGSTLFSAINSISTDKKRTTISKSGLWTAYQTTDLYPSGHAHEGKIWDIYSNCYYTYSTDQCGNVGSQACVCYNKEHSVPQNWLGSSDYSNEPAKDIVHIFPTDGKVNGVRSNYPYGETNAALLSTQYGSSALGRFGSSKLSSYSGDVYEPDDEYKGDLARVYMYMRAHYATWNIGQGTGSAHFSTTTDAASDSNFGMTAYSVELLMEWHRNDPVSQKEIDRNNGIETVQGNRNPFVDYPALAEYLWGTKKSTAFSFDDVVGSFDTENFIPGTSDGFKTSGTTTILSFASASVVVTTGSTVSNPATTNSTCATISYSSSNTSVATVNSSGVITGVGDGTCTITASISACGDFSAKTATCTVTVGTTVSVTWMANGSQFHQNTALSGSAPSLPNDTPDDCTDAGGKKFVGWIAEGGNPENYFTTTAPTISANTTFLAVYATASQSSGNTSTTVTMTSFDAISGNVDGDENVSYEAAQGGAATAPAVNNSEIRIYQNGGTLTITANNSKKLTSVTIGSSMGTTVTYSVDGGTASGNQSISANGTYTLNNIEASLVLFTCTGTSKTTRLYLNNLSVTYSGTGSTTTYSDFATSCSGAAITYATVTFHKNDGSATTTTQQVQQGNTANLTANPWTREHYTFLGWSTSSTATEATYSDGASYTFSADADLYAVWKEDDQYTVTFMNNGSAYGSQTNYAGESITGIENPSVCEGYTFEGWSTQTYAVDNTAAATIDYTGTIPENGATYYAVYTKTEGGSGGSTKYTYNKVTSTSDIEDGDYLIVYETGNVAFNGALTTLDAASNTISVTLSASGDSVTNFATVDAAKFTITADGGNIKSASNKYIGQGSNANGLASSDNALANTLSIDNGNFVCVSSGGAYLRYNATSGQERFRYFKSSTYSSQQAIQLYKKVGSNTGGGTTYHTTAPDCTPACNATITVQSLDDAQGTVSFE